MSATGKEESSEKFTELQDSALVYWFTGHDEVHAEGTAQVRPQVYLWAKNVPVAHGYDRDSKTVAEC